MATMKDLREIVYSRSRGYCEKCGKPIREDDFALHHRKLKSRGGADEIVNLVALHHGCHNLDTDSVHSNPEESERMGLMVGSWQDPIECPVTLPSGDIVILTTEGSYHYLERKANGW